ncbi:hypothetical protein KI387_000648 [Taxus chinensis]|uniref:Uncharacterized protein n=1 Tax=Taxus chinensis TaxID=29808 RepID=A0AA38GUU4_TAXCH|nr:hypothetical protein KI387_000648 [Taxus chinensis]
MHYGDISVEKTYHVASRTKAKRSLFRAREDRLEKAWERKRDQVLLEELGGFSDNNNYSDSYSSKTAQDSCGEEARINSLRADSSRAKSLTNVDLDELKGCLDLGFGLNYDEMPELYSTLPALELCYVMGQQFHDDIHLHHKASPVSIFDNNADSPKSDSFAQYPIANWKISSPDGGGCLDLGFGLIRLNYDEMLELSSTLPAWDLCYVMGQQFHDDIHLHHKASPVSIFDNNADSPRSDSFAQSPIAN